MNENNVIFPNEVHMDEDRLKKLINLNFICKDCKSNVAICFICKVKGKFYSVSELNRVNKKKDNKSKNNKDSLNDDNDIELN